VIEEGATYAGAAAVAILLERRGNRTLSQVFRGSGILGKFGYRWIAGHRNSSVVRLLSILLEKVNTFN
jgi:hypothetical protein